MVSFVVVEYHSQDDIKRFLSSIACSLKFNYEVIVSSNSMYGNDLRPGIRKAFPTAKWIFNDHNGGFAYAMNKGLEIATGDFLVIVNPDVSINMDLSEMITFFKSDDTIGAIAPQILNSENVIQDSFREYVTLSGFFVRNIKRLCLRKSIVLDKYDASSIQSVDWLIGAFIMIKREVYLKVGGLDDRYFLYCEDMDWCTSIRHAGFDIIYYPRMSIIYEGTRSARRSLQYFRIFVSSLIKYWNKFGCAWVSVKREKQYRVWLPQG